MIQVSVRTDTRQIGRLLRDLDGIRGAAPRAMSAAIKRTTDQARTRIVRGITDDVNVAARKLYTRGRTRGRPIQQAFRPPAGRIEEGHVAVVGSTEGAAVSVKDRIGRLPLGPDRFAARRTSTGISYQIDKGSGRKRIPGAFLLAARSGFTGAFIRVGRGRGAIAKLYGPSIPQVAENSPGVRRVLNVEAGALFVKNLASQVDRILQRRKGGR